MSPASIASPPRAEVVRLLPAPHVSPASQAAAMDSLCAASRSATACGIAADSVRVGSRRRSRHGPARRQAKREQQAASPSDPRLAQGQPRNGNLFQPVPVRAGNHDRRNDEARRAGNGRSRLLARQAAVEEMGDQRSRSQGIGARTRARATCDLGRARAAGRGRDRQRDHRRRHRDRRAASSMSPTGASARTSQAVMAIRMRSRRTRRR